MEFEPTPFAGCQTCATLTPINRVFLNIWLRGIASGTKVFLIYPGDPLHEGKFKECSTLISKVVCPDETCVYIVLLKKGVGNEKNTKSMLRPDHMDIFFSEAVANTALLLESRE